MVTRKERAFAERERLIVETADGMLWRAGYLGLNLDELAERVEYSKATLYNHFASKEDLVLAVVSRQMERRVDFFTRAVRYDGRTRERIFAIGLSDWLLSRLIPHGFPLVQLVRSDSIWGKCSEGRRERMQAINDQCFRLGMDVVDAAGAAGDLDEGRPSSGEVVWGLVSLSKGAHLLADDRIIQAGVAMGGSPMDCLIENYHRYLDGCGWRPFWREFDYEASRKRIEMELFAEEFAELEAGAK
ncbi:MAG: TetR/AcrR family transcriptional regulator [Chthoniobacterales bacterium]